MEVEQKISNADGILLATPVYNYALNAAAKNLLELIGGAWSEKVVGFLCAAGGHGSYMSIMPFANSLMLDFRTVIIPPLSSPKAPPSRTANSSTQKSAHASSA